MEQTIKQNSIYSVAAPGIRGKSKKALLRHPENWHCEGYIHTQEKERCQREGVDDYKRQIFERKC